ncbi:MAG: zf-HC2 domain-containing protein [Gemmatimonadetes bacterium]|nr:zf-HC2 domain-containing protein [Gemmatimonadota bacterium]
MIDRWADRLSEYLDGDLDARDEAAVDAHLVECAGCRATLAELRAVVARAAALQVTEPEADLWPAIRQRIEADAVPDVASRMSGRAARRRISLSVTQLAAAAAVLALVSAGSVWIALSGADPAQPIVSSRTALTSEDSPAIGRYVSNAPGLQAMIAQLEHTLSENRESLDPMTIAVLESNLQIIDAAIAQAVQALDRDPNNAYLRQHLGNTVDKKIAVLRRAAAIERSEI